MRLAIIRLALLIIPSGMICFLGCSSPNSLQIISLENGNIISLEDKFLSQQSLLASGNDNRSFWTIAKNCSNQMAILKYNLYGKLQYKITLPFSFYTWAWHSNRVFIPETMILIYTDGNKIFKYDINKNKKDLLGDFNPEGLVQLEYVNAEMLIVKTLSGSSSDGSYSNKIYNINIKTGEVFFKLTNSNDMQLLGISKVANSFLLDTLDKSNEYILKSYDLVTGEEKRTIVAKDFYCSEAVWSPNGDSIIYDISNNLYITNLHSLAHSPILIFKGNDVNIITHLSFISANTILFLRCEDDSFRDSRLIVYNVNKKQEVINKKINARTEKVLVVGNHIVIGP